MISSSCGSSVRHLSVAYLHRGWNLQPGIWASGFGGSPGSPWSPLSLGLSNRGMDASSPRVYGCFGSL